MFPQRHGTTAARIARAHGLRARVLASNTQYAPGSAKIGPAPLGAAVYRTYGNDWVAIYDIDPLTDSEWADLYQELMECGIFSMSFYGDHGQ